MTTTLFNPERIIEHIDVPTFRCHGTRHVEFLKGGYVRNWLCVDLPAKAGVPPMYLPVAIVTVPMACYVWNILAQAEHAFDRGVLRVKPRGPDLLRPSRMLMN